jgi:hypothetical protein
MGRDRDHPEFDPRVGRDRSHEGLLLAGDLGKRQRKPEDSRHDARHLEAAT